jgi:hypothetical protein
MSLVIQAVWKALRLSAIAVATFFRMLIETCPHSLEHGLVLPS